MPVITTFDSYLTLYITYIKRLQAGLTSFYVLTPFYPLSLSSSPVPFFQLWLWPTSGGKLTHLKNLTGHTGRVEALAMTTESAGEGGGGGGEAVKGRAASSGRDSTLKV